jgi:hypothetical protein
MCQEYGIAPASRIWNQWRGAYYYAAKPKNGGPLALVFVSKWGNAEAADRFAKAYADSFATRYEVKGDLKHASPVSVETNEGPVSLEKSGTTVIAIESLDREAAQRVRDALLGGMAKSAAK